MRSWSRFFSNDRKNSQGESAEMRRQSSERGRLLPMEERGWESRTRCATRGLADGLSAWEAAEFEDAATAKRCSAGEGVVTVRLWATMAPMRVSFRKAWG